MPPTMRPPTIHVPNPRSIRGLSASGCLHSSSLGHHVASTGDGVLLWWQLQARRLQHSVVQWRLLGQQHQRHHGCVELPSGCIVVLCQQCCQRKLGHSRPSLWSCGMVLLQPIALSLSLSLCVCVYVSVSVIDIMSRHHRWRFI
jgi:hypothetical protein